MELLIWPFSQGLQKYLKWESSQRDLRHICQHKDLKSIFQVFRNQCCCKSEKKNHTYLIHKMNHSIACNLIRFRLSFFNHLCSIDIQNIIISARMNSYRIFFIGNKICKCWYAITDTSETCNCNTLETQFSEILDLMNKLQFPFSYFTLYPDSI